MKKTWATLLIAVLFATAALIAHAADPYGGRIAATLVSNTSTKVTITTRPAAVDSVFVCRVVSGTSDTLFVAQIDTTTSSVTVTGLNPGETNYWFLLTRQGAGGPTALSDIDTLTQYGPEIEAYPNATALHLVESMIRAVSWRPSNILTTFTVNGATGADSTGHYRPWNNHSITVKASQAGDSVKVMAYIAYGKRLMTQTGATFGFGAYTDSLNIYDAGTFTKTLTANTAFETMYIKFAGYTGNGKNTAIEVEYVRDRY